MLLLASSYTSIGISCLLQFCQALSWALTAYLVNRDDSFCQGGIPTALSLSAVFGWPFAAPRKACSLGVMSCIWWCLSMLFIPCYRHFISLLDGAISSGQQHPSPIRKGDITGDILCWFVWWSGRSSGKRVASVGGKLLCYIDIDVAHACSHLLSYLFIIPACHPAIILIPFSFYP